MPEHPFVSYLCELARRDDRGALASLRRGVGKEPGVAAEMHPYVAPWLPRDAALPKQDVYYQVAALFALHPQHADSMRSLGATFRQFAGDNSHHILEAMFKGFGRALRKAVAIDPACADEIPSTKGTLGGKA